MKVLQLNCIFAKTSAILKRIIVILLLLVFSLRPMYYLGCLAYYGANINAIIEQFCVNKDRPQLQCDGKCFLAEQLNEASESNQDSGNKFLNSLFESFIPIYVFTHPEIKFKNHYTNSSSENVFGYKNHYTFLSEGADFKPPIL